jgi:hypothetical protein
MTQKSGDMESTEATIECCLPVIRSGDLQTKHIKRSRKPSFSIIHWKKPGKRTTYCFKPGKLVELGQIFREIRYKSVAEVFGVADVFDH